MMAKKKMSKKPDSDLEYKLQKVRGERNHWKNVAIKQKDELDHANGKVHHLFNKMEVVRKELLMISEELQEEIAKIPNTVKSGDGNGKDSS